MSESQPPKSIFQSVFGALGFGTALGFVISGTGFSEFGELHKMLRFEDLRLFLTFAGALSLTILGYLKLRSMCVSSPKPWHKGTIFGAILFGLGWAITGACPSVPLVQLGEGRLWGLVTLVGVVIGTWSYEMCHRHFFSWDRGEC